MYNGRDSSDTLRKGYSGKHLILDSTQECLCGVRGDCHRHSHIEPSPGKDGVLRYHGCRARSERAIGNQVTAAPMVFKPSEALKLQQQRLAKTHYRLMRNEKLLSEDNTHVYDDDQQYQRSQRGNLGYTGQARSYSRSLIKDHSTRESQETARFTSTEADCHSRAEQALQRSTFNMVYGSGEEIAREEEEINFGEDRDKYDEVKTLQRECDKLEEILSGTLSRISTMQKYKQPLELDVASKRGIENRCMEKDAYFYPNGHTTTTWESMRETSNVAQKAELSFGSREENPSEIGHCNTSHQGYRPLLTGTDKDSETLAGLDSFLIKCRERHYKDAADFDYSHWKSRGQGKQSQEYYGLPKCRSPRITTQDRELSAKMNSTSKPNYHLSSGIGQGRNETHQWRSNTSANYDLKRTTKFIRIEDDASSQVIAPTAYLNTRSRSPVDDGGANMDFDELRRLTAEKLELQSRVYKTKATLPYMDTAIVRCMHMAAEMNNR